MTLPCDLKPRSFLGQDAISYSELSTLASCETKWMYSYGTERTPTPPSAAMKLGSEVHEMWGGWWMNRPTWVSENDTANWLMDRYARYYDGDRRHGQISFRGVEVPLAAQLPWGPWFFGFTDGLADVGGIVVKDLGSADGLWISELKTADNFSSIRWLTQSPQGGLYVWAARQMGLPVRGIMLDVIRTSGSDEREPKAAAYKRLRAEGVSVAEAKERSVEERLVNPLPLHESFERRWLTWADEQLDRIVQETHRAVAIRLDLLGGAAPLRNVGPSCGWCFHIAKCFDLELDILPEDDDF